MATAAGSRGRIDSANKPHFVDGRWPTAVSGLGELRAQCRRRSTSSRLHVGRRVFDECLKTRAACARHSSALIAVQQLLQTDKNFIRDQQARFSANLEILDYGLAFAARGSEIRRRLQSLEAVGSAGATVEEFAFETAAARPPPSREPRLRSAFGAAFSLFCFLFRLIAFFFDVPTADFSKRGAAAFAANLASVGG